MTRRNPRVQVRPSVDGSSDVDPANQGLEDQAAMIVTPANAALVEQVARIGCAYCFWTINPEDADEHRRAAVQVGELYYHTHCWSQHPRQGLVATPATVPTPPPLIAHVREPVALRAGPLNTLYHLPLGISHSTLQLETAEVVEFTLRNNAENAATLSRQIGPPWAAFEFHKYDECSGKLILLPKDTLKVQVYPSFIRPMFMTYEAEFNEHQSIDLESNTVPVAIVAVITGFAILWVIHIFNLYGAIQTIKLFGLQASITQMVISTLSLSGMIGLAFFMAANWILWSLFSLIDRARHGIFGRSRLIDRLLEMLQYAIWFQFARRGLVQKMHTPMSALLQSVVVGIVGGIVCGLSALLILMLLNSILFLVWISYAGLTLWLLHSFLLNYGFNGVILGRRIYRFLKSLIHNLRGNFI